MKFPLPLLPLVAVLAACSGDIIPTAAPRLVVEGWIDADGPPVVILTTTAPVSTEYQSIDSLGRYVVRWARVAVSDGENEVVLMGHTDADYTPPYVYTTSHLYGRAGGTYRLTVDYADYHAEAVTTIPPVVQAEGFRAVPAQNSDTLFALTALLRDDPAARNYYKVFTRTGRRQTMWLPSMLGTFSDETLVHPVAEVPVYKSGIIGTQHFTPYFERDDVVLVKLAAVDSVSHDFWQDYEASSSFGGNFFLPSTANLRSNVSGALGYWCGYGATITRLRLRDLLRESGAAAAADSADER